MKKSHKRLSVLLLVLLILSTSVLAVSAAVVYKYGDVNGDSIVNLKDVTLLKRMLSSGDADIPSDEGNPDANGDGSVNLKDATWLQRYLAGGWGAELPGDTPPTGEDEPLSEDLAHYEVLTTNTVNGITSTSFRYGKSVRERDLICWSIQPKDYSRTILLNFEIHGWEDAYAGDGQILVDLGNALVDYYSKQTDLHNCRLLIIPSANPDGLADGGTNNGFGRCNADGVDLNRDFDANHIPNTSDPRYYTEYPFSAPESRGLRDLVLASKPNIVIDFHGWQNFTLGSSDLAEVFSLNVGLSHKRELTTSANGYFAYWAQLQGAEAMLVEFKNPDSAKSENVIKAVNQLVADNYGSKEHTYELDERYKDFTSIQCRPLTNDRVYTQSAVGNTGTAYGYINGADDICTIKQIYSNGWCKVSYPVGNTGYTKTGYCELSAFINPTSEVNHYKGNVGETVAAYKTPNGTVKVGSVWDTDTFTVIAEEDGAAQIIFPLDAGGYKLGWIDSSKII